MLDIDLYNITLDEFKSLIDEFPVTILIELANTIEKKDFLIKNSKVPMRYLYVLEKKPCDDPSICICNTSSLHLSCEELKKILNKSLKLVYYKE